MEGNAKGREVERKRWREIIGAQKRESVRERGKKNKAKSSSAKQSKAKQL
jgi:hypothetical protein